MTEEELKQASETLLCKILSTASLNVQSVKYADGSSVTISQATIQVDGENYYPPGTVVFAESKYVGPGKVRMRFHYVNGILTTVFSQSSCGASAVTNYLFYPGEIKVKETLYGPNGHHNYPHVFVSLDEYQPRFTFWTTFRAELKEASLL